MYVLQGRLPPVIRDIRTANHEAALLPITERLGIGCYLSAPVILPDGRTFGTLCCFSRQARPDLVDEDGEALGETLRAAGHQVLQLASAAPDTPPICSALISDECSRRNPARCSIDARS